MIMGGGDWTGTSVAGARILAEKSIGVREPFQTLALDRTLGPSLLALGNQEIEKEKRDYESLLAYGSRSG